MKYVLGFLFNEDYSNIALIRKEKPEWQKGFLNGIGGKIEENETPIEAMRREFREEAGMIVHNWREFCVMAGKGWIVHCFVAKDDLHFCQSIEEEKIEIHHVDDFQRHKPITNLLWLINMALDKDAVVGYINYNS